MQRFVPGLVGGGGGGAPVVPKRKSTPFYNRHRRPKEIKDLF